MNITEPSRRLTRWRPHPAEYDFQIKHKKCSDNAHADTLSRLITGARTEPNYPDDIPAFSMESEADPQLDDTYPYPDDASIEDDYYQINRILEAEKKQPRDLHLSQITLQELIFAQLHDAFCSEIHQKIDEGRVLRSALTKTDSFSEPQILAHKLSSLTHSSNHCWL